MALPFLFPLALIGLLSIIPLIILYMLLPKPFKVSVPSVMFLMKVEESREKIYSSITKLVKDPLFLIQLLVLILLAIAAAGPFILTYDTLSDESTVLIIDGSASMQTNDRFDEALRTAPNYLSRVNTVILAGSVPIVVAENVSASDAESAIRSLSSRAVTADLGSAMASGANVLSAKGGSIYVLSDFTSWDGLNPVEAKNLLGSGLNVTFVPIGTPASNNMGIINGYLEKSGGTYNYYFMVRNYDSGIKSVYANVTTTLPNGSTMTYKPLTVTVPGNGVETFVFKNVSRGTTEIQLMTNDVLKEDNYAYVSLPGAKSARALYVSDAGNSVTLPSQIALSLIPELSVTHTDLVPSGISSEYSFVVVNRGDKKLSSSEIDSLNSYANSGGNIVFVGGEYLSGENQTLTLSKMLPARLNSTVSSQIGTQIYAVGDDLTRDLDLDDVYMRTYLSAEIRDSQNMAYPVMTKDGVPIIAYGPHGSGIVFYFGLNDHPGDDAWNNFASFPAFPIFWIRMTDYFAGIGDISEYNVEAGTIVTLSGTQEVLTPQGKIRTNKVLMDSVGIYTIGSKKIAVNMYNDKESNTLAPRLPGLENSNSVSELPEQYEIKTNLFYIFAALAAIFILLELYLLRKRGEI